MIRIAPTSELTPLPGALVSLRPDAGWEDVTVMLVIEAPPSRTRSGRQLDKFIIDGTVRTLRDFMGRPYLWVMHPTLGPTQIPQGHVEGVVQGCAV